MYSVIRKHALKNALDHGKAILKAVIPKVIGEVPEAKKDIKGLSKKINEVLKEVNKMSEKEILKELTSLAPELLEEKEEQGLKDLPGVKGEVVMRFAPFPSGAAHIGNTRGMILTDEYVKRYGGKYYLVFDDTIGSTAKPIDTYAYKSIPKMMKWLGCKLSDVLYKSDRLEQYYKYAEKVIKKGLAYVCECPVEKMRDYRAKGIACPHRNDSASKTLTKWKKMFKDYEPGEAVLRLRTNIKDKNPAFRDRVIMRISDREHPRVKTKYRVWPLMDFSWTVDDLALKTTHILRGKELYIEDRMQRFIWKKMGEKYDPVMDHWGLLRIKDVKISKSKSKKEVDSGQYSGWDDPRTWSLESLKRRGIKPIAIREFITDMGLSESDITVPIDKLYTFNRRLIDSKAKRYFFVKDPVKLVVRDCPEKKVRLDMHPNKNLGSRSYVIEKGVNEFFISKEDVSLLKKEGRVRLKDAMNIEYESGGEVIKAFYSSDQEEVYKIQKIQFVTKKNLPCKVLKPDGSWDHGACEDYCSKIKKGEIIQFERYGFCRKEGKGKYIYTHG